MPSRQKLQAIVVLGLANSRMKDFYDLLALSRLFDFEGSVVHDAIIATFERRVTDLPKELPIGLTAEFGNDPAKTSQWNAFVNREPLLMNPGDLIAAIKDIAAFVGPPLKAASDGVAFALHNGRQVKWLVDHQTRSSRARAEVFQQRPSLTAAARGRFPWLAGGQQCCHQPNRAVSRQHKLLKSLVSGAGIEPATI